MNDEGFPRSHAPQCKCVEFCFLDNLLVHPAEAYFVEEDEYSASSLLFPRLMEQKRRGTILPSQSSLGTLPSDEPGF